MRHPHPLQATLGADPDLARRVRDRQIHHPVADQDRIILCHHPPAAMIWLTRDGEIPCSRPTSIVVAPLRTACTIAALRLVLRRPREADRSGRTTTIVVPHSTPSAVRSCPRHAVAASSAAVSLATISVASSSSARKCASCSGSICNAIFPSLVGG